MSAQDAKLASFISRLNEPTTSHDARPSAAQSESDMDDEDIFAELEAEIENDPSAEFREHGMERLKREVEQRQQMQGDGHGQYREITDEKEVIRLSAHKPRCVIHFFHHKFKRCEIMDKHLQRLAPKYFGTLFIRVFVENAPWLVERLGIKVLPCVLSFVDGIQKNRIIGFEDLGNSDQFETATLEWKLLTSGALVKDEPQRSGVVYDSQTVRQRKPEPDDNDSDFDLDE